MQDVSIRDESIRLGQLLKLAGAVESGAMAKDFIAEGLIIVNGKVCSERGERLFIGDVVTVTEQCTVSGKRENYRISHQ